MHFQRKRSPTLRLSRRRCALDFDRASPSRMGEMASGKSARNFDQDTNRLFWYSVASRVRWTLILSAGVVVFAVVSLVAALLIEAL
jgi:hypothetical protein